MRVARLAVLGLVALALSGLLSGCETTAEKSARLAREAKHVTLSEKGLVITRRSADVEVVATAIVHDSERAAAIVTLRNRSAHAERAVPIAITVRDSRGRTLLQNNAPGLESALVSVPSIGPHATVAWVDDQLPPTGPPASVSANVGASPPQSRPQPAVAVSAARISEDPANGVIAGGTVVNRSKVAQSGLAVFAIARRGGKIVAAGRAIVPELAPGASTSFQASLVGAPSGARLAVVASPADFE